MDVSPPPVQAEPLPPGPAPARLSPAARARAALPLLAVAAVVVALDALSKAWIVSTIGRGQAAHEIVLLQGWLALQYVENRGAAFGLFTDGGWLLAIIAAVVVVAILASAPRLQQDSRGGLQRGQMLLSFGLVLGGAVGNLLDRLTRGYVVDFIRVPSAQVTLGDTLYRFPNFNVADSAITVGIVLLVLYMLFSGDDK
jgi:signal peptidase II